MGRPEKIASPRQTDLGLYRRLLSEAKPYGLHILGLFLLNLLSPALALLTPLPLKIAVDSAVGSRPIPEFLEPLIPAAASASSTAVLVLASGMLVAIGLLTQLQAATTAVLQTYSGEKMVLGFRAQLFRHAQRLSLSYHDSRGTSDSIYRIQYDTSALQHIAIDGVVPLLTSALTLLMMFYVTLRLDWQLALVALAVSPIIFLLSRAYRRSLRRRSRELKGLDSAAMSVLQETLGALRVVKAFGQEEREEDRFARRSREGFRARLRLSLAEGGLGLLVGVTTSLGTAAVLFLGIRHVQSGMLTLGELLLVMGYMSQLYGPLKTIGRKAASFQSHLASAERAFAILDQARDVPELPNARPLLRASGKITFRHVSFGYNGDSQVLHRLSFDVQPGSRVGIAGRTGAGKTTLVGLLNRFHDPTDGQILLDDVDLREYRLADLRSQFAIVLQEPLLFSASIAENIAYARPAATKEEIVEAARVADADEFILGLRDGYDTVVGERGMRLSGGERQRIALARAFLKDAPILILDEPTSSVDLKTEARIMAAIERLARGRTTFMIAHRPSTLESCDLQFSFEDGRLVRVDSRVPARVKAAL